MCSPSVQERDSPTDCQQGEMVFAAHWIRWDVAQPRRRGRKRLAVINLTQKRTGW